jgi:serine protease Do
MRTALAASLVLALAAVARAQEVAAPVTSTASPGALAKEGPAPNEFTPRLSNVVFPSIVKVYGAGGFKGIPSYGTGVVVDASGIVATSWSIALTSPALKVVTDSGERLEAKLLKQDTAHGLALLKVETAAKLAPLALADELPKPGEVVFSIGNAFDDAAGDEKCAVVGGVVTAVTALDVRVGIEDGPALGEVILTDAPNNPGTQGGALVSRDGKLLGILGRLVESKNTNTQINFAVPAPRIRSLVAQALGAPEPPAPPPKTRPPQVETGIRLLDAHLTRSPPAYVERVVPLSPADKAGVRPDDLIFKLGNRVVRSCRQFEELVAEHGPGERVHLVLKRGSTIVELDLELVARKES